MNRGDDGDRRGGGEEATTRQLSTSQHETLLFGYASPAMAFPSVSAEWPQTSRTVFPHQSNERAACSVPPDRATGGWLPARAGGPGRQPIYRLDQIQARKSLATQPLRPPSNWTLTQT